MIELFDKSEYEATLALYRGLCTRMGLDFDGDILPSAVAGFYELEYAKQGKRYPSPRKRKSKMRMSKEWRNRNLC